VLRFGRLGAPAPRLKLIRLESIPKIPPPFSYAQLSFPVQPARLQEGGESDRQIPKQIRWAFVSLPPLQLVVAGG
jgi:hypothetical protein